MQFPTTLAITRMIIHIPKEPTVDARGCLAISSCLVFAAPSAKPTPCQPSLRATRLALRHKQLPTWASIRSRHLANRTTAAPTYPITIAGQTIQPLPHKIASNPGSHECGGLRGNCDGWACHLTEPCNQGEHRPAGVAVASISYYIFTEQHASLHRDVQLAYCNTL